MRDHLPEMTVIEPPLNAEVLPEPLRVVEQFSWILQNGYCVAWPMDTALYTHPQAAALIGIEGAYAKGFIVIYENSAKVAVQTPAPLDAVDFAQLSKLAGGKRILLQHVITEDQKGTSHA